ncbi:tyrosine-type recombinase/integrase [Yoonia sp.]|uniref:tyrosine-type recombinase/integrase n=1 Tax=Yoonia sp. TaxID=2212373 RepID=UPI00358E6AFB
MPKLTKRFVESLTAEGKDFIIFDSEVNGFGVRVMPSGRKSYVVQYRNGGRTRRMVIGRHGTVTSDEARKEAIRRLGEVARGDDPSRDRGDRRRAPTVSYLCDRFIEDYAEPKLKPRTVVTYQSQIKNYVKPKLGSFKIEDVCRADIAALHHSLRDRPYQANRVLMLLSRMFNMAELWGLRSESTNPCRMIPKNRERSRERFLSQTELMRLGEVFQDALATGQETHHVIAAFQLLLLTGCRLGEIQTLKWDFVTMTHLELPDSKTGKRRIPLSPDARMILENLPDTSDNPYVIVGKNPHTHIIDLERPWRRLRDAAGMPELRIHDLRHTFASIAVMNGVDLLMVGKILGHSNYQTTMRYAHLADAPVRAAADKVSGLMAGAVLSRTHNPAVRLRVVRQ